MVILLDKTKDIIKKILETKKNKFIEGSQLLGLDTFSASEIKVIKQVLKLSKNADFENKIEDFENKITGLNLLNVMVGYDLTKTDLEYLINNLEDILKEDVLLKVKEDKSIIGGAIFEFKGKYFDFSVKEMLVNCL